jgi:hypothetical protein
MVCSASIRIIKELDYDCFGQGVTKRCRLSWLTNSALVYEPKYGGRGELRGLSQSVNDYLERKKIAEEFHFSLTHITVGIVADL